MTKEKLDEVLDRMAGGLQPVLFMGVRTDELDREQLLKVLKISVHRARNASDQHLRDMEFMSELRSARGG